jgi:hypothetical protein
MAWESKFFNFGVVKIDGKNVKVYYDSSQYRTISVGEEVISATWAGGELNVTLKSGKVRRYHDTSQYRTI